MITKARKDGVTLHFDRAADMKACPNSIADLPVASATPEFMSEKAIAIGQYFVASGVYTVFGVTFPIIENTKIQGMFCKYSTSTPPSPILPCSHSISMLRSPK